MEDTLVLIALDIDGTIAIGKQEVQKEIALFLTSLVTIGHHIAFLTGRTISFGAKPLKKLDFPYYFSGQNGSIILKIQF